MMMYRDRIGERQCHDSHNDGVMLNCQIPCRYQFVEQEVVDGIECEYRHEKQPDRQKHQILHEEGMSRCNE